MGEKLNNPESNQGSSGSNGWENLSEVPFAGGSQVEDINKAQAMAEAANENMTIAARANKVIDDGADGFEKFSAEQTAERQEKFATIKAERAAQEYDGVPKDERVEDVDKAMEMAMAENQNRTLAAKELRTASIIEGNDFKARGELINKLRQQGYNAEQIKQIFANPEAVKESAAKHNADADRRGEDAGYLYDARNNK